MHFKCKLLAKDKITAKALVQRYDLPPTVLSAVNHCIDMLEDDRDIADGVSRIVDVIAEGNIGGEHGGMSNLKLSVCYRLVL
jgi:hypothetical protein